MLGRLRSIVTASLVHLQIQSPIDELGPAMEPGEMIAEHPDANAAGAAALEAEALDMGDDDPGEPAQQPRQTRATAADTVNPDDSSTWGRVSRNAQCPCGSGKKYKHCHGTV